MPSIGVGTSLPNSRSNSDTLTAPTTDAVTIKRISITPASHGEGVRSAGGALNTSELVTHLCDRGVSNSFNESRPPPFSPPGSVLSIERNSNSSTGQREGGQEEEKPEEYHITTTTSTTTTTSMSAEERKNGVQGTATPSTATAVTGTTRTDTARVVTSATSGVDSSQGLMKSNLSQASLSGGIPISRYREKLEECAILHNQLQNTVTELCITREHLGSAKEECDMLVAEIVRLRDVLNMTTSELHAQQQRVEELWRENRQLQEERRGGPERRQQLQQQQETRLPLLPQYQLQQNYQQSYTIRSLASIRDMGGSYQSSTILQSRALGIHSNKTNTIDTHVKTITTTHASSHLPRASVHRPTHSAADMRIGATYTPPHTQTPVRVDTFNVTDALMAYVCECFRTEVIPHMELLHSLYDGGRLMAVDPPITFAQLTALKRVIIEAKTMTPTDIDKKEPSQSQQRTMSVTQGRSTHHTRSVSAVPMPWLHNVGLLSFRSDSWYANLGLLLYMIHTLPSVREVEIFAVRDNAVMERLAEVLIMKLNVEVLSLPEIALTDEGLRALFSLIIRREKLSSTSDGKEDIDTATASTATFEASKSSATSPFVRSTAGTNGKTSVAAVNTFADATATHRRASVTAVEQALPLTLHCLDLSRCSITCPTTLLRGFRCSTLEVLILTACSALRDVHVRGILEVCPQLHTLDLSGSEGLSNACVTYISQHDRLKVLRLENCPGIKKLELTNIEVLFSSLAYVAKLYAPTLRRLPIPLTQATVLYDFFAPRLTEITLKGIMIGHGTLSVFTHDSADDPIVTRCGSPTLTLSNSSMVSSDVKSQLQQQEKRYESCDVPQLLSVGFIDCVITHSSELKMFLQRQVHLLRLSLHGCRGVMDTQLSRLPRTLVELDVGGVAQLTSSSIQAIVTRLPNLVKLSLKQAGTGINNTALHQLCALGNLEVMNLLGLPQLRDEVVAAVVAELPKLRVLYHETVVVETRAAAAASTAVGITAEPSPSFAILRVERSDEEDDTRRDIHHCTKELLQLRDETALALWMEAQLPKPTTLLPQDHVESTDVNAARIPHPPLSANTTYYELTRRTISRQGTYALGGVSTQSSSAVMGEQGGDGILMPRDGPDIMTFDYGDDRRASQILSTAASTLTTMISAQVEKNNNDDEDNETEDEDDGRSGRKPTHTRQVVMENGMAERERLAIEKAPLGPWDDADIVAEHRRHSGY